MTGGAIKAKRMESRERMDERAVGISMMCVDVMCVTMSNVNMIYDDIMCIYIYIYKYDMLVQYIYALIKFVLT